MCRASVPACPRPTWNLLVTLDVLLAEGGVARAARRLRLSPSAMSRALRACAKPPATRCSCARAGARPSPRATGDARPRRRLDWSSPVAVLSPAKRLDPATLADVHAAHERRFVENFGPRLLERVASSAPGDAAALPQARQDAGAVARQQRGSETGLISRAGPELRSRALFRDHGRCHARASRARARRMTLATSWRGAGVSRRGGAQVLVRLRRSKRSAPRRVVVVVGGFAAALAWRAESDLVATVPARHTEIPARGPAPSCPVQAAGFTVAALAPDGGRPGAPRLRECVARRVRYAGFAPVSLSTSPCPIARDVPRSGRCAAIPSPVPARA